MEEFKGKVIDCPGCKDKSRLNVKKVYDGLSLAGYEYICSFCGQKFDKEKIPFAVGENADSISVLSKERCENCAFYAKNAWVQKCTKKGKQVDALSSCRDFKERDEKANEFLF